MAAIKLLDDPDHINSFLSMIGASPIPRTLLKRVRDDECEKSPSGEEVCNVDISPEHAMTQ
jgi:hypothetical protein